jgi:hypothetical protein
MKTLDILLLGVQLAVILVTGYAVAIRAPSPQKPRPVYTSLMLSLFVIAAVSFQIADRQSASAGASMVQLGAALVFGVGIAMAMCALGVRRGNAT